MNVPCFTLLQRKALLEVGRETCTPDPHLGKRRAEEEDAPALWTRVRGGP